MDSDKTEERKDAAVPPPVIVEPPAAPAPAPAPAPKDEVAAASGLFKGFDPKNPVPTILAVYGHFQLLNGITDEERLTLLQGVFNHLVDTSPGLTDEQKVFSKTLVPHIVQAADTLKKGIHDLIPAEFKVVEAKVRSCFGW
jgi:hypothetical protein